MYTPDGDLNVEVRIESNKQDVCSDGACDTYFSARASDLVQRSKKFSLEDANDFITRCLDCWNGNTERALTLKRSVKKVSAEIAAALDFYHNRNIFSDQFLLSDSFLDLPNRIFICDAVNELQEAIYWLELQDDELKLIHPV